jgi:hypothetical protein
MKPTASGQPKRTEAERRGLTKPKPRLGVLDWDGVNEGPSGYTLREVVENMRKVGALVEIVGHVLVSAPADRYNGDVAQEFVVEAGSLLELLGARGLELLDALDVLDEQAAPGDPAPVRQPRVRAAKRRAA